MEIVWQNHSRTDNEDNFVLISCIAPVENMTFKVCFACELYIMTFVWRGKYFNKEFNNFINFRFFLIKPKSSTSFSSQACIRQNIV